MALNDLSDDQVASYEQEAQHLTSRSLIHIHDMPDPQLASEAIQTGSTPQVAEAFADPELSRYMGAHPSGLGKRYTPDNGDGSPLRNLWGFDKAAYDRGKKALIEHAYPAWAKFGEAPVLNLGWMDSVRHSDPNTVRKWQNMLSQKGYYTSGDKHDTGVWGKDDEQAFVGLMTHWALPFALWDKNEQMRNQARAFLGALNIDVGAIDQRKPGFQRDVAGAWLKANGHDHPQDALHEFSDRFGIEHLPDPWRRAEEGGTLGDHLLDTLHVVGGIVGAPASVGHALLTKLGAPEWLSTAYAAGMLGGPSYLLSRATDPEKRQADIEKQLVEGTPKEVRAAGTNDASLLAGVTQRIGKSTGFLPFQWWDEHVPRIALGTAYFLGDAVHGQVENPFDTQSAIGQHLHNGATQGWVREIFGEEAAKHLGPLAGAIDELVNTLDDPTIILGGPLVRAPRFGAGMARALGGSRRLSEAVTGVGEGLRPSFSREVGAAIEQWIRPRQYYQRAHAIGAFHVRDSRWDLTNVLGITDEMRHPSKPELARKMDAVLDEAQKTASPAEMEQLISRWFPDQFGSGMVGAVNRRQALESMTPEVHRKMGGDFLTHHLTLGSFTADAMIPGVDEPIRLGKLLEQQLIHAGYRPEEITPHLDHLLELPQEEVEPWLDGEYRDLLNASPEYQRRRLTVDRVAAWAQNLRRPSVAPQVDRALGEGPRMRQVSYAPSQPGARDARTGAAVEPGTETSRAPRKYPETTQGWLRDIQAAIDAHWDEWRVAVDRKAKENLKADPSLSLEEAIRRYLDSEEGQQERAGVDGVVNQLTEQMHSVAPLGPDRPAPAFTSQLSTRAHLPVGLYDQVAYMSPTLHAQEELASRMRLDAFYRVWKPYMIAWPSTATRLALGEHNIRTATSLALEHNSPISALRFLAGATARGFAAAGQEVGLSAAAAVRRAGERGRGMTAAESRFREEAEALASAGEKRTPSITEAAHRELSDSHLDALTLARALNESDSHFWDHFRPRDPGFERAFAVAFGVLAKAPEVRGWAEAYIKGGPSAAREQLGIEMLSENEKVQHLTTQHQDIDRLIDTQHQYLSSFARDPEIRRWLADGQINHARAGRLYHDNPDVFPLVAAPRDTLYAKNGISRAFKSGPEAVYRNVLEPMIAVSRAESVRAIQPKILEKLREVHGEDGPYTADEMQQLARARAFSWVERNHYNGQRTVMGKALRHSFPFWGATANMSRFFVRQAQLRPQLITPALRGLNAMEAQAQNREGSFPVLGNVLTALGFSGGDALSISPAHALFLTSDGLASFIPGLGPIYAPMLHAIANDQRLSDTLGQIPGLSEQLGFQAGAAPRPLSGRIEQLISGLGLISPWHKPFTIPILGGDDLTYQRRIHERVRSMYADYKEGRRDHPPTEDEARASLGAEQLAGAGLGALLPILPQIRDQRADEVRQATKEMDQATTDAERDAVINAHEKIRPLLQYFDKRTSLQQRDDLVASTPWLAPYITSLYGTQGTRPTTQQEYDAALRSGNLHLLGVDSEFVPDIEKHDEYSQAYRRYAELQAAEQTYAKQHNLSPHSKRYQDWVRKHVSPAVDALMEEYPRWAEQFLKTKNRSQAGLEASTRPLRTVATWETIPTLPGLENGKSIAWRNAFVAIGWAQEHLRRARAGRAGSRVEDRVLNELHQRLDEIAATDHDFAAELRQYRYSGFDDLVNLQSMETPDERRTLEGAA